VKIALETDHRIDDSTTSASRRLKKLSATR
jgi:hypothetical protein